jgi:sugar lactone lactonase YvrE
MLLGLVPAPGHAAIAPALPIRLLFTVLGYTPGQPFRRPAAVALDQARRTLYVADPGDHAIVALSLQGVPGYRLEAGPRFEPISIALDPEGRVFASDRTTGRIRVFGPSGALDQELDLAELGHAEAARAGRITLSKDGQLYCVDQANCRILVLDAQRRLRLKFGGEGNRAGLFKMPEDVAVDRFGRIYVSDSLGTPLQVFDASGVFLYAIGRHGEGPGDLSCPTALFVDRFDQIWVTDTNRHQIVIYDRTGWPLRAVGEFGQTPGRFFYPVGLALDGLGRLYVAEREGQRVQVFTYDNPLDRFSR